MPELRIISKSNQIVPHRYKAKLSSSLTSMIGYLTLPIGFNLDNGIVNGLIEIDINDQNNIGKLTIETQYTTKSPHTFKDLSKYYHTYTETSKSLNNEITIYTQQGDFTFYNVYLNRHKADEKLFHFIAQASVDRVLEFKQAYLPLDKQ